MIIGMKQLKTTVILSSTRKFGSSFSLIAPLKWTGLPNAEASINGEQRFTNGAIKSNVYTYRNFNKLTDALISLLWFLWHDLRIQRIAVHGHWSQAGQGSVRLIYFDPLVLNESWHVKMVAWNERQSQCCQLRRNPRTWTNFNSLDCKANSKQDWRLCLTLLVCLHLPACVCLTKL